MIMHHRLCAPRNSNPGRQRPDCVLISSLFLRVLACWHVVLGAGPGCVVCTWAVAVRSSDRMSEGPATKTASDMFALPCVHACVRKNDDFVEHTHTHTRHEAWAGRPSQPVPPRPLRPVHLIKLYVPGASRECAAADGEPTILHARRATRQARNVYIAESLFGRPNTTLANATTGVYPGIF